MWRWFFSFCLIGLFYLLSVSLAAAAADCVSWCRRDPQPCHRADKHRGRDQATAPPRRLWRAIPCRAAAAGCSSSGSIGQHALRGLGAAQQARPTPARRLAPDRARVGQPPGRRARWRSDCLPPGRSAGRWQHELQHERSVADGRVRPIFRNEGLGGLLDGSGWPPEITCHPRPRSWWSTPGPLCDTVGSG